MCGPNARLEIVSAGGNANFDVAYRLRGAAAVVWCVLAARSRTLPPQVIDYPDSIILFYLYAYVVHTVTMNLLACLPVPVPVYARVAFSFISSVVQVPDVQ